MNESSVLTRDQIHQVIDRLRPEQLERLWEYVEQLAEEPVAPLYNVHEYAISTGLSDLADQHDHYLYGVVRQGDG
jgi:hypothetical protein